ncbi:hypothetical protein SERLADRAFT_440062 [Serpula lacrymans var. lacrymans S7.9]|uniref:Uncharacterized protein n=1 Tax=Serpula lacrymans var. lacrymans (strain S7.9) TaxID=578457 RepID=F8P2F3_SERL9|nr:uncharacterized protein SERLADRAFT_440062 [Serpula lacrymans var. lacrymans S7.9]EGO23331.1 hypothetical protein SERLADRAFT_440062 [Serpula lacrymans var. lacrymans S7.9]
MVFCHSDCVRQVVLYAWLGEFELLKRSCHDILKKPWAVPSNCELAVKYFKVIRAQEEIKCLNVEIRRLHEWVNAEDAHLLATAEGTAGDEYIALEINAMYLTRQHVNNVHRHRLQQIYNLKGFSGDIKDNNSARHNNTINSQELDNGDDEEDEVLFEEVFLTTTTITTDNITTTSDTMCAIHSREAEHRLAYLDLGVNMKFDHSVCLSACFEMKKSRFLGLGESFFTVAVSENEWSHAVQDAVSLIQDIFESTVAPTLCKACFKAFWESIVIPDHLKLPVNNITLQFPNPISNSSVNDTGPPSLNSSDKYWTYVESLDSIMTEDIFDATFTTFDGETNSGNLPVTSTPQPSSTPAASTTTPLSPHSSSGSKQLHNSDTDSYLSLHTLSSNVPSYKNHPQMLFVNVRKSSNKALAKSQQSRSEFLRYINTHFAPTNHLLERAQKSGGISTDISKGKAATPPMPRYQNSSAKDAPVLAPASQHRRKALIVTTKS